MSDRYDLPKIKPDEAPSILNHEAGKWGWLGGWFAAIPSTAAHLTGRAKLGFAISGIGVAAGALYGGLQGKAQQEREIVNGRVVKDVGYWNKGILSGLTVSSFISIPFLLAGKPLSLLLSLPIGLGAMAIGSTMRKNSLQRDFDRAVAARDNQLIALGAQQQAQQLIQGQGYKNSVTPEESAALAAKQQASTSHTEKQLQSAAQTASPQIAP